MGKHPLAFLGKKNWHTKNLKNVEKVWIADEKDAAEAKKLADLQRQIIEERQMDELREMQASTGSRKVRTGELITPKISIIPFLTLNSRRNEFRCAERLDWMYEGPMSSAKDAEKADEYLLGKAFEPVAEKVEVSEQISRDSQQPGALWSAAAAAKPSSNETFSRLHEDPMVLIRKQELKARESVVKNPLKMVRVKTEIEAQLRQEREAEKEAKRKRKDEKKARKRDRKDKKESKKESKRAKKEGSNSSPLRRRRSPSASSASSSDRERDREHRSLKQPEKDPRYGLQRGTAQAYSREELGPSAEARTKVKQDVARPNDLQRRPRAQLTEEERAAKLEEMQADASKHDSRLKHEKSSREDTEVVTVPAQSKDPTFIKSIERDVYLSDKINLEERMKRNRQNHQQGAELRSDGFMRQ